MSAGSTEDLQDKARARVLMKQDARVLFSAVSAFAAKHERSLRKDELALFRRVMVLIKRIAW